MYVLSFINDALALSVAGGTLDSGERNTDGHLKRGGVRRTRPELRKKSCARPKSSGKNDRSGA